jgi:hypothetical protein
MLAFACRPLKTCSSLPRALSMLVPPNTKLRLLVVDGYAKQGRDDLEKGGMLTAGALYDRMMGQVAEQLNKSGETQNLQVECKVIYPADKDYVHPNVEEYDGVGWTGSSLTIYHSSVYLFFCLFFLLMKILF